MLGGDASAGVAGAQALKQLKVEQVGGAHVLHGGEQAVAGLGDGLLNVSEQLLDPLAPPLDGAAQVAGDDGERAGLGVGGDLVFGAVDEGADDLKLTIIGGILSGHALDLAGVEHVEQERLNAVIAVVTQGDAIAAELAGVLVDDAAAQAAAQGAGGGLGGELVDDDTVGVLAPDEVGDLEAREVVIDDALGVAGLALVEVKGGEAKGEWDAPLHLKEHGEHGVGVFAPRQANEDVIVRREERVIEDGALDAAIEAQLELFGHGGGPRVRGERCEPRGGAMARQVVA